MKTNFLYRTIYFYYDGFRHMTVGRTLWAVIIVKLIIIFLILKIFFFPNYISEHSDNGSEPDFVASELIDRAESNVLTPLTP